MTSKRPRVLVVEDDTALRDMLAVALRGDGYEIRSEGDGTQVRAIAETFRPDLAVLDVRLPDGPDGYAVARTLRAVADIPIIFLTAADTLADRLHGFEAGADDYLAKPFAVAELLARVRALLRRSGRLQPSSWQVADLVVDEGARTARRDSAVLDLTRTEFDLLNLLGRHQGQVLSKNQILALVWGFEAYDPNLVEVHLSALRRKLEAHGPRLIHTVRGVGYVLRV